MANKHKNSGKKNGGETVAPTVPLGAEGWKDILQLLKEQGEKIEKLDRAFKVIQDGMLRNNPAPVKVSVGEAAEVLGSLLYTHNCLVENGKEIQKRLDSLPANRRAIAVQRPRSASLGDTPKQRSRGEKRQASSTPEDRVVKKGKAAKSQPSDKEGDWQLAENKKKKKRNVEKKEKRAGPLENAPSGGERSRAPRRHPTARSSDAIRVSAKDGESYADILKEMKARVDPTKSGLEVLGIRRTRKEEILLVLKKGGDVLTFKKALDEAVGGRAEVRALVTTKAVEVRDLDETVTREEVLAALGGALGKDDLGAPCRLFKRFGGVRAAVVQLSEADAESLLRLGKVRLGWVNCRVRENIEVPRCFRCLGYGHGSRGCKNPSRKDACWRCGSADHVAKDCKGPPRCLTCLDRDGREVSHTAGSGSCPVFREELRKLRCGN